MVLEQLQGKIKQREAHWSKFFEKWNKPSTESENEGIPCKYLTGRNAYFDKRKLSSVRGQRLILSKYGKIRKYKKVHKRKRPNAATNGVNPVGEKSVLQFQELDLKQEDSLSIADDHTSSKCPKEATVDVNEKQNTREIGFSLHAVKSEQTYEGNTYEDNELSPVLKKPRLHTRCVRKFRTNHGDQDVDTPVKSKKVDRNGCEDKILPSVPGESVCNGLDRPNPSLKIDEAADKSHSNRSYTTKSRVDKNGCEDKIFPSVPGESVCKGLDRPNSSLKIDEAADKSHSNRSYTTKSRVDRNGCEDKILPSVPGDSVCNGLDRSDSSLKIDAAADKSHSNRSYTAKSLDNKKGCEDKLLPSMSGQIVCNGLDRQNSRLKIDVDAHKTQPKNSYLEISQVYRYRRKSSSTLHHLRHVSPVTIKPWGYEIVESDPSDLEE